MNWSGQQQIKAALNLKFSGLLVSLWNVKWKSKAGFPCIYYHWHMLPLDTIWPKSRFSTIQLVKCGVSFLILHYWNSSVKRLMFSHEEDKSSVHSTISVSANTNNSVFYFCFSRLLVEVTNMKFATFSCIDSISLKYSKSETHKN